MKQDKGFGNNISIPQFISTFKRKEPIQEPVRLISLLLPSYCRTSPDSSLRKGGRGPDKVSGFQGSALDTESDGRYTRARCVYFGFRFLLQEPP